MNVKNLQRYDVIRLDANDQTFFTKEGYLIDHPIVTRVGIFEYHKPDGTVRREFRPPEEVFNEESLESYVGKPVIITHDAGLINKDNVTDEEIGTILEPGYRDGDKVRAKIVIHDTESMKDSGLRELSLGYNLDLDETEGEYEGEHYDCIQRNIRINHLALVGEARAGDSARLNIDGKDTEAEGTQQTKGGSAMRNKYRGDGEPMTPEDFDKGIKDLPKQDDDDVINETVKAADDDDIIEAENTDEEDKTPEEKIELVRDRRDCRKDADDPTTMEEAQKALEEAENDIDVLLDSIDEIQAASDVNKDSDDDENCDDDDENAETAEDEDDEGLTKDSVDRKIAERVSILRNADRLNLDGVDNLSNLEVKKRIIKKLNPKVRLDGKSKGYINYAYEYAIENLSKKGIDYQRKQMRNHAARTDSADTRITNAMAARERMIAREGGKN